MLLELTEQELDIIKKAIIAEHGLDENLLFNDKQKKQIFVFPL
jgi:hypothetical protein